MSLRDSLYRVESQKSKVESGMLIRFDALDFKANRSNSFTDIVINKKL